MIIIKKDLEIEIMRRGGKILFEILERAKEKVKAGIETIEINNLVNRLCF